MTNIIKFDGFDSTEIRTTEDGRFSVYDVIKFCGCKSHHEVWKRIRDRYPDLAGKCQMFKFPGKGGAARPTPVAAQSACEEILAMLGARILPGDHPGEQSVTSDKFFPRTEIQVVSVLQKAFSDLNPIPQFQVHGYRIDLYLALANIAIEVDEYKHRYYQNDSKREKAIKSALGCSFVRFDPYAADFNIGDVIFAVRGLI